MQKIFFFLSLLIAKAVPAVIAAGKAGGTAMVIKSNDLSTMFATCSPCLSISGSVAKKPSTATQPMAKMNFRES